MFPVTSCVEVEIPKARNSRIGIDIQTQKHGVAIVSNNNNIDCLYVGDYITHVNGKKYSYATTIADKIWKSEPTVKLHLKRGEKCAPLISG